MKSRTKIRFFNKLLLINFFALPFIGWYFGGVYGAVVGFAAAYIADSVYPRWYYDLKWEDIDNAFYNIYKFGKNPCSLCFIINSRKIFILKNDSGESKENNIIPMSVRIPFKDWEDLFANEDLKKFIKRFGGDIKDCKYPSPSYVLYPKNGLKDCKKILRLFIEKGAGDLNSNVLARTAVNSSKNIWKKHKDKILAKEK